MLKGGEKLAKYLRDLAAKVSKADAVKVGFLEGSTYPDGTSVPFVAAMNEYGHTVTTKDGSYFQLPRPYFRKMISEKSPNWGKQLGRVMKAANYDSRLALARMGEGIASQLQESIRTFSGPPLADSTVARKGFDKQLIETAVMINSVAYQVSGGEKTTADAGVSAPQLTKLKKKKAK